MSGPEEVERLIRVIDGGIRQKMLRPKCLARPTWVTDGDRSLLARLDEESREFVLARRYYVLALSNHGANHVLTFARRQAVFEEECDRMAFAAMLVDPRRLARLRWTAEYDTPLGAASWAVPHE